MSPIRPSERTRYPKNWKDIVAKIRARSGGRCECMGECGLHRDHPGPRRCEERNGQPAKWARGTIVLTVAHRDHTPENVSDSNLADLCQRCHNRYDQPHRQQNAAQTRRTKKKNLELFA